MSYAPVELGRGRTIIQKGEPTFIEAAAMSSRKEVPHGSKYEKAGCSCGDDRNSYVYGGADGISR